MRTKKIRVDSGKDSVKINVKVMNSAGGKMKGLMFERYEKAKPVIFEFRKNVRKALHTFFCSFPILVLWLNKNGKIINYQAVNTWNSFVVIKGKFSSIIEIPLTKVEYLKFKAGRGTNLSTVIKKIKNLRKVRVS